MTSYKTEWIEEDKQRVMTMDRWYIIDGRHRKSHPLHGLYTGLAEKGESLDRKDELEIRMCNAYERNDLSSRLHK